MPAPIIAALITAFATIIAATIVAVQNLAMARRNLDESKRLNSVDQGRELPGLTNASIEILAAIHKETERLMHKKYRGPREITMKFIGVSMSYSWSDIIERRIPEIVENNPEITFRLEGAFVDSAMLYDLELYDDKQWAQISEANEKNLRNFGASKERQYPNLSVRVSKVRSIPQWHGWLIADQYLYLGRVRFDFEKKPRPSMQVGENEYRCFHSTETGDSDGDVRINLFSNWLDFYMFDNSKYNDSVYPEKAV